MIINFFFFLNREQASLSHSLGFVVVFPWEASPEGEGGHACPIPWDGLRQHHSLPPRMHHRAAGKSRRNCIYAIIYLCYNMRVQLLLQGQCGFLSAGCTFGKHASSLRRSCCSPSCLQSSLASWEWNRTLYLSFYLMEANNTDVCVPGWVWLCSMSHLFGCRILSSWARKPALGLSSLCSSNWALPSLR